MLSLHKTFFGFALCVAIGASVESDVFAGAAPADAATTTSSSVILLSHPPVSLSDGVTTAPLVYWRETWTTPRPVQFHFLRLDLRSQDFEISALVAPDPDGAGPAESS